MYNKKIKLNLIKERMLCLYKIKTKSIVLIALIMAMSIMVNGCSKGLEEGTAALVDKEKITMDELDEEYSMQLKAIQSQFGDEIIEQEGPDGVTFKDQLKKDTLNRMIVEEIIIQDAKKKNIKVSDEEIEEILDQVTAGMGGEEQLKEYLKSIGMEEEYLKEYNEKTLILQKHKEDFIENVELKDEEGQKFFDENKEKLTVVKARHILVESEEEGKEVLKKLNDGGDFAELALENSKDLETATVGGDLGYFSKEQNPAEFDKVVFALNEGELSSVFQSEVGYHIVEVQEKKDTFESLKPELMQTIKENKYIEYIEKIQEDAKIETFLDEENKELKEEDKKDTDKDEKEKDKKDTNKDEKEKDKK